MAKRRLTQQQEFEIMKLVFDKFLWIGFLMIIFGVYNIMIDATKTGIAWMAGGIIVIGLFLIILLREFEIIKH